MLKFHSRTLRVQEMGGKFYVEVKNKAYAFSQPGVPRQEEPVVDTNIVHVLDTADDLEAFIKVQTSE